MKTTKSVPPVVAAYHHSVEQLQLLVSKFLKYAAANVEFVRSLATGTATQFSIKHALEEQGHWVDIHVQAGKDVRVTVTPPRAGRSSHKIWLHIPYAAFASNATFDSWMAKYCKQAEAEHLDRFVRDQLRAAEHARAFARLPKQKQKAVKRLVQKLASKKA